MEETKPLEEDTIVSTPSSAEASTSATLASRIEMHGITAYGIQGEAYGMTKPLKEEMTLSTPSPLTPASPEANTAEDEGMISSTPSSVRPATKRVKEETIQSTPSSLRPAGSLHNRLATVAAALRLQDATGASHLQQIEINPEAYGVAKSSRPHI